MWGYMVPRTVPHLVLRVLGMRIARDGCPRKLSRKCKLMLEGKVQLSGYHIAVGQSKRPLDSVPVTRKLDLMSWLAVVEDRTASNSLVSLRTGAFSVECKAKKGMGYGIVVHSISRRA